MSGPFIKQVVCDSARDLLEQLAPINEHWTSSGGQSCWVFRGQRKNWEIVPSAWRGGAFKHYGIGSRSTLPKPESEASQMEHEQDAVLRFVQECMFLGLSVPEDGQLLRSGFAQHMAPEHENLVRQGFDFPHPLMRSLFALAQHHGVPTRLVDWSRSPLVAAYFACESVARAATRARWWDTDSHEYERGLPGVAEPAQERPVFDPDDKMVISALHQVRVLRDSRMKGREIGFDLQEVTAPYDTNARLRAQLGTFTMIRRVPPPPGEEPGVDTSSTRIDSLTLENYLKQLVEHRYGPEAADGKPFDNGPLLIKFHVKHEEGARILRRLRDHRVTKGALYPGYSEALESLAESQYFANDI